MPASISGPLEQNVKRLQDVPPAPSLLSRGEKLYSPSAIAKLIPSHREKAHVNGSTIFRWLTRGVKTPSGEVVRLEGIRLGSFWRTSLEAIERFSAKLTAAATQPTDPPSPPNPPTPAQQSRAAKAASAKADAIFGTTTAKNVA